MRSIVLAACLFASVTSAHAGELILPGAVDLAAPKSFRLMDFCPPRQGPLQEMTGLGERCFSYNNEEALLEAIEILSQSEWSRVSDENASGVPPIFFERSSSTSECRQFLFLDLGTFWIGADISAQDVDYVRFFLFTDPDCGESANEPPLHPLRIAQAQGPR